jgi:glycosyltransferase involved in cell wall biosynthesis
MSKRILYISYAVYPSRSANSIQSYKMASALAGLNDRVYFLARTIASETNIREYYGKTSMRFLPFPIVLNNKLTQKATLILFPLVAKFYLKIINPDITYIRDVRLLATVLQSSGNVVVELHAPIDDEKIINSINHAYKRVTVVCISKKLHEFFATKIKCKTLVLSDACTFPVVRNINPHENQVVFTGHLYEHRGVDQILRIAKQFPKLQFIFVGGTESDISKWKNENRSSNVKFLGFTPPSKITEIQQRAGFLIINYSKKLNTASYCSPLKLMEYISTTNIVIATNFGPIIEEYKNYLFVCEADDDLALASLLHRLVENYNQIKIDQQHKVSRLAIYTWEMRASDLLSSL